MAAIIGVLATLCGPAIELGKCFAEPIKRQFNYLCYYNSNIQNLREEARELKDARDGLDRRVDTAENNAEVILPEVETWLKDVNEIQEKTIGILSEITNIQSGFLTIKSRFSLSKKAKKAAEALKELRTRCNFHPISYSPPPAPIPLGTTYEFESRKQTEEEIMITLQDNEVNTIGICGMGGVGKTTMAKRVMHRAREEHLFDETVMVVVSQQVDMLKIQTEIAEKLALKLGEQILSSRAQRLHTRLVGRKRILIILDDVWEKLKLDDLGIPDTSGLEGLTVLLTSRNSNILKAMNVQRVYALEVLSGTEARFLFKSNVGTCIDDRDVSSVAQQVVQECNGLPIALVTVGLALKDQKNISIWRDALQQLKTSNPIDMPEVLEDVYKPLKLSYEFLKNERAKSLFLLCCLFPEDHLISVSHLTFYAKGLGILEGIWNLEQARNRTCSLVAMLKSRSLLLDIDFVPLRDEFVRMHDVFRDLAIFIASEERHIIKCRDCTWISSYHLEGRAELLMGQNPNLRLLLIENSANKELIINDSLFEGTRELNVLSISNDPLRSLPHTTHLLKNLRTLILYSCASLETISVAGELVSLEILICDRCKSLVELPVEIKKLNQLKLLGLKACWKLQKIAPGVIPSLVGLEELGMYASFNQWEAEDEGKDRKYASLNELKSLSSLTCLEIDIKDLTLATQEIRLSSNIENYFIRIGKFGVIDIIARPYKKRMQVGLEREITLGNWVRNFLRRTEALWSEGDGSSNVLQTQFRKLKWLTLTNCSTVQRVVNVTTSIDDGRYGTNTVFPLLEYLVLVYLDNLEEIWDTDGPISSNSFKNLKELGLLYLPALKHLWKSSHQNHVVPLCNNLSSINITECDSLHNLLSMSLAMAKDCLLQLERLEIRYCKMMEEVVFLWNEEENDDIGPESHDHHRHVTLFPKLKILKLDSLPNLRTFCKGIKFPLPTQTDIRGCPMLQR